MTYSASPSRHDRIQRIGHLLSKGISLLLARHSLESGKRGENTILESSGDTETENRLDETEQAIIRFICKVGNASPRELQTALDLPKTSAFRKLDRLVDFGLLARSGRTSAIRYRIKDQRQEQKLSTAASALDGDLSTARIPAIRGKHKLELNL